MSLHQLWFNYTAIILEFLFELVVFFALLSAKLKRREGFWPRLAVYTAASLVLALAVAAFYTYLGHTVPGRVAVYVALFALVYAGGLVLLDAPAWTVLFCTGAAYTAQNLVYKLYVIQYDLGRLLGLYNLGSVGYRVMYYGVFALLAALLYRLILRRMREKLAADRMNYQVVASVLMILGVSVLLCSAEDILFDRLGAATGAATALTPLFALRQTANALGAVCGAVILLALSQTLEQRGLRRERDYDSLTGLLSRRAFYDQAEDLFDRPAQLGCAALLMLDLDNLKFFNDHYGHDCGDAYIRSAGESFARHAPKGALCARVSGDEFFLLFYGYPDADALRGAVDAFAQAIAQSTFQPGGGEPVKVSASVGVACYPQDGDDLHTLMKLADHAMYQVKRTQKGKLGYFDRDSYHRHKLPSQSRQEFLRMVREERVFFHFQPIVEVAGGRVYAYEALMRTDLPTLSTPQAVLEAAKALGQLQDVEALTWLRAPGCFRELLATGQAAQDAYLFVDSLAGQHMPLRAIARFREEPADIRGRMVVEIIHSKDMTAGALQVKRSAPGMPGLFALDNYGSDSCDESVIPTLAPQFAKLDPSLIRGLDRDADRRQRVAGLIDRAHDQGIRVVAVGVETAAELDAVLALGADFLQGDLLAPPAVVPGQVPPELLAHIREGGGSR